MKSIGILKMFVLDYIVMEIPLSDHQYSWIYNHTQSKKCNGSLGGYNTCKYMCQQAINVSGHGLDPTIIYSELEHFYEGECNTVSGTCTCFVGEFYNRLTVKCVFAHG